MEKKKKGLEEKKKQNPTQEIRTHLSFFFFHLSTQGMYHIIFFLVWETFGFLIMKLTMYSLILDYFWLLLLFLLRLLLKIHYFRGLWEMLNYVFF